MRAPARCAPEPRFLYRDAVDLDTEVGRRINSDFLGNEETIVRRLADEARLSAADQADGAGSAARRVGAPRTCREVRPRRVSAQYDLSSQEGVILMCLAEALLRIPDDDTADRLIADKIRAGDWESPGRQRVAVRQRIDLGPVADRTDGVARRLRARRTGGFVSRLVTRMGEPMVRGRCARQCASWVTSS